MNRPPFFIVGMGRSGTTLLRLMLNQHPNIAIPYESGFLADYASRAGSFGSWDDDRTIRRAAEELLAEPSVTRWDHVFDLEDVISRVVTRSPGGVVDALYRAYSAAKGKARWGDKSDYLDRMHEINQLLPGVQFIHIIRDGRDVASSVLKQAFGPDDIIRAAEWWNEHLWVARRIGAFLGPDRYCEVRYEDLVMEPERELRRLCAFLGEDYSPALLSYHEKSDAAIPAETRALHRGYDAPPDQSRVSAWKREMSHIDVALFNRHARRMLLELGYEIPADRVSRVGIALGYLRLFARRFRR